MFKCFTHIRFYAKSASVISIPTRIALTLPAQINAAAGKKRWKDLTAICSLSGMRKQIQNKNFRSETGILNIHNLYMRLKKVSLIFFRVYSATILKHFESILMPIKHVYLGYYSEKKCSVLNAGISLIPN